MVLRACSPWDLALRGISVVILLVIVSRTCKCAKYEVHMCLRSIQICLPHGDAMELDSSRFYFWYQRAHVRWLLEGDQNTAYFHRVANGMKMKNALHSLDDNGMLIEGTKNLG
jgi:hypothetical protein